MKEISLNQGRTALLDDNDYERLSKFHWTYRGEKNNRPGYAIRHDKTHKKKKTVYLHREIMNPPPGYEVIFKNNDRLDCRRENLAVVTRQESRRRLRGFRDQEIRFDPAKSTWSAFLYQNGNCFEVGPFDSEMQALFACDDVLQAENPGLYLRPVVA